MKNLLTAEMQTTLIDMLKKQGLSFLLLGVAVYFFYGQYNVLSDKINDCNQAIIDHYERENEKLYEVIERNTMALDRINEKME